MQYGLDDSAINKARNSEYCSEAANWDIETILKYTDTEQIYRIKMLDDRSLFVCNVPVPCTKFGNVPVYDHFIVEPTALSYINFLAVAEISEPGQEKSFFKPRPEEVYWKIEYLPEYFDNDCMHSVELTLDGKVEFTIRGYGVEKPQTYSFDASGDKGKLILKLAGITSPGEKVNFPKAEEKTKNFLRTGEEPRWIFRKTSD